MSDFHLARRSFFPLATKLYKPLIKGAILRLGLYDYRFFRSWCAGDDKVMIQKSGAIVKAFNGERRWLRSGRRARLRGWGRAFPAIRDGWAWRGAWPRPAHEIMAQGRWKTARMVEVYTRAEEAGQAAQWLA